MIEYINEDCMIGMTRYPDKYFDLAIVDPPYNVGASDGNFGRHGKYRPEMKHYENHDTVPDERYFDKLFRVSKNQIVWGMNYYPQHFYHSGAIIWLKKTCNPLSDAEIAFQSYSKLVKVCDIPWFGFTKGNGSFEFGATKTIHPNQKPIALYKWLLTNYAKPGDKILDTHVGSASSLIACYDLGFDAVGFELDPDYYKASKQRLEDFMRQPKLAEHVEYIQTSIEGDDCENPV
jgi:site-specific DNA-methyltransferase (adenine-specific)